MVGIPAVTIFVTVLYKYALDAFPLFWFPKKYEFKAEPDFASGNISISRRLIANKLHDY